MEKIYHDHVSIEEFVRALARSNVYKTYDAGSCIDDYWRGEAIDWVKELDSKSNQGEKE